MTFGTSRKFIIVTVLIITLASSATRLFDGYSQLTNEQVAILGQTTNGSTQRWNAAGRRAALISGNAEFDYSYRVDGLMSGITAFGSTCNFTFGNNGLLASRGNPWRTLTIGQRDGQGRVLSQTNVVAGANTLVENLTWRANSTIASYGATRNGTGAWNENRGFGYNTRGQVTNEPVGLGTGSTATNAYAFDTAKLGVLTGISLSGASTNNWQALAMSSFSQITTESWNEASISLRAGGSAINASSISALLDGSGVSSVLGRWYADLSLSPGNHTLAATANYTVGNYAASVTNSFSVVGNNSVTNLYDATGNVTNRLFANGKTQALTWDAAGRLLSVIQRENITNGFNWTAIYDALGRRIRTTQVPLVNGATNSLMPLAIDSLYDPQVEFGEVAVAVNGVRTWKIVGPDSDGHFGSMQGVGGLEATYRESDASINPVINDFLGNVPATINYPLSTINWSATRLSGYGPEIGYEPPTLNTGTLLADTLTWRSRRIDPSGLYCLGARHYEPMGGRFLSADPLGHGASWDLYSFCNGDPLNRFDPTGRFAKAAAYGLGDVMDKANQIGGRYTGPSYRSMLNGSVASDLGYMFGYAVGETTFQASLFFAFGGISSLAEGITARTAGGLGMDLLTARTVPALEAEGAALGVEGAAIETEGIALEVGAQAVGRELAVASAAREAVQIASARFVGVGTTTTASSGAGQAVVMNVGEASPVAAPANLINSRLANRLEAWRSYQGGGGTMSMREWVSATQRQYGGVSGGYSSGYAAWDKQNFPGIHGNSRQSTVPATLYGLFDKNDNFLKWGVSIDPTTRYSSKVLNGGYVEPYLTSTRGEVLDLERWLVERTPGPVNREPWAGWLDPSHVNYAH